MQNVREKLRRKLSMKDQQVNFDDHDDADDETTGNLHREINEAEENDHPQGRPGSFLNRLISHGNKKTEDQIAAERAAEQKSAAVNTATSSAK